MQKQTLLLDVGRVIAGFDHLKPCAWIASKTGHSAEWVRKCLFSPHGPAIRHEEGSSSQQFFDEVCILTGLDTDFDSFAHVWSDIFTESQDIGRILGHIESHVSMGIVSNTDPLHWHRLKNLPVIKEHFTHPEQITASFEVKNRKPNVEIYQHALKALGADITQTLYIDDVEQYVKAFRLMGGKAEVYNCEEHKPLRLERILKHYGYMQ